MSEIAASPRPSLPTAFAAVTVAKAPTERNEETGFGSVFRGLGRQIDRGERSVNAALSSATRGADLDPNELLALQAGIYRYSEAVDLAAKLVDRIGSGVKTVVAGQ